jgi:60 kDa SS-A/Ro ribonucleoprotein
LDKGAEKMRTNIYGQFPSKSKLETREGGPAEDVKPYDQLRRLVLASMLWEDGFYVDGKTSAEMVHDLCKEVDADGRKILHLAWEAHDKYLLRHMPLFLVVQALKKPNNYAAPYIQQICSRPDQMTELLSLYWKDGKKPLSKQLRKGLALAFGNFDSYQLAKYNRDNPIKLRDILFLCHPKPKNDTQADTWKKLANKTLESPDTWEVRLSAGEDKKESFQELLEHGKMGTLAILRNMRNMHDVNVPRELVRTQLLRKLRPMLPFQFIAAAKADRKSVV